LNKEERQIAETARRWSITLDEGYYDRAGRRLLKAQLAKLLPADTKITQRRWGRPMARGGIGRIGFRFFTENGGFLGELILQYIDGEWLIAAVEIEASNGEERANR